MENGYFPNRPTDNFTLRFPVIETKIYHFCSLFAIQLELNKSHQKKYGSVHLQVHTLPNIPKYITFTDWSRTTEVRCLRQAIGCSVNAEMSKLQRHSCNRKLTEQADNQSHHIHYLKIPVLFRNITNTGSFWLQNCFVAFFNWCSSRMWWNG